MPIEKITSFYDLVEWIRKNDQHIAEIQYENIELEKENRRLQSEVFKLKAERTQWINELIAYRVDLAKLKTKIATSDN